MPLPNPIPDELAELIARRLRAIGEPMRIRLLDRLRDGEATVSELTQATGASQQNVSKHLAVLADWGSSGAARTEHTSTTGSRTRESSGSATRSAVRSSSSMRL